jgi:tetratricopeptide (TPR) repeat protein
MLVHFDQPGLSFSKSEEQSDTSGRRAGIKTRQLIIPSIFLILILSLGGIFRSPFFASLYANLGALEMSRWELKDWPKDQWNGNPDVSALELAEIKFEKALTYSPLQRTALHRLGLISMQSRDFDAAQTELEKAFEIDPNHRGIRKSLGYAYVWGDRLQRAKLLLDEIDEAKQEMKVYTWWWEENDRLDLSSQANEMVSFLEAINQ